MSQFSFYIICIRVSESDFSENMMTQFFLRGFFLVRTILLFDNMFELNTKNIFFSISEREKCVIRKNPLNTETVKVNVTLADRSCKH